jgi:long-subunit acyl-CoA synthetase (AMP-forming)
MYWGLYVGVLYTYGERPRSLAHSNAAPQCDQGLTADDVYLSFLPLAHIFGRVVEEILLHSGARIGYWQGIPDKLLDDVAALQPTIFCGYASLSPFPPTIPLRRRRIRSCTLQCPARV